MDLPTFGLPTMATRGRDIAVPPSEEYKVTSGKLNAEHGVQQLPAAAADGYDGHAEGFARLFERDVVEEDALAVAEHGVRDEHALPELPAFELRNEVAAGDEPRDVYRVAEEIVDYGAYLPVYFSTLFVSEL